MNKKTLHSSHIFLFPFKWDYLDGVKNCENYIDKRIDVLQIDKHLDENKWEKVEFSIDNREQYNQYAYYYENVRRSIYTFHNKATIDKKWKYTFGNSSKKYLAILEQQHTDNIVTNLQYKDSSGRYIIKTANKEYSLEIEKIKLKVYSTGVGILSFHLDNFNYSNSQDVLRINDYGRRIYPQFLGTDKTKDGIKKTKEAFLADELKLVFDNGNEITENFSKEEGKYFKNPNEISKTIMCLLGSNFVCDRTESTKNKILVCPIIDDRMFTMSWYSNDFQSGYLSQIDNNDQYKYLHNDFWYRYMFIDNDSCTCQSKQMLTELIKKSTYERWVNYNTFYGITRYSFVMLGHYSEKEPFFKDTLLTHMKTIYYEMVCIALVQRASILRFSDEVTTMTTFKDKNIVNEINELHKKYIEFINKLYFREVTAQEQGIELYDKLIELMRVEREISKLNEEINELHQYALLNADRETNTILNIIAYIGAGLAIPSLVTGLFGMNLINDNGTLVKWFENWSIIQWLFNYVVLPFNLSIVLIILFKRFSNNKILKKLAFTIFVLIFLLTIYIRIKTNGYVFQEKSLFVNY